MLYFGKFAEFSLTFFKNVFVFIPPLFNKQSAAVNLSRLYLNMNPVHFCWYSMKSVIDCDSCRRNLTRLAEGISLHLSINTVFRPKTNSQETHSMTQFSLLSFLPNRRASSASGQENLQNCWWNKNGVIFLHFHYIFCNFPPISSLICL